jgi:malonyl-CoA decarboxylase
MAEITSVSFFDRTVQNIREVWREMADRTSGKFSASPSPGLADKDVEPLKAQLRDCLEARGGEVSARGRAANLGRTILSLNSRGRRRFLQVLARDFDVDRSAVDRAVVSLQAVGSNMAERIEAEQKLRLALQPPRVRLLTQFNGLPEGVHFLVELRAELLAFCKGDPALTALERDFKSLLSSWFDVGFLELREITWDSSASLLEKLISYEAVHAIKSWDDMKKRLSPDRRCFAFFHPRMPSEPLIFVEVALVNGIAQNIQLLLDKAAPTLDPAKANAAIFYSISNTQEGLAGISFGNFLIKRVVDVLASEFKGLKTFATLSPIPGFRSWLVGKLAALQDDKAGLLSQAERKALHALYPNAGAGSALLSLLQMSGWYEKPEIAQTLKAPLMRLCTYFLVNEKRANGAAYDRVAHFHLSNGARIERLNWLGNSSSEGLTQSAGIMVNYRYKLDDIEANHEAYTGEGRVRISSLVRGLLKS